MKSSTKYCWIIYISALLVIIFASSFAVSFLSLYDQKRIAQCAILLFSSLATLILLAKYKIVEFSYIFAISSAAFVLLLLISSLSAPLKNWALLETGWYILGFQFSFVISFLYLNDIERFKTVLVLGVLSLCIIYSSRVYADYIIGSIHDYWTTWPNQRRFNIFYDGVNLYPSGFLGFVHVRFFNHLQTWTLPILVFGFLNFKKRIIPGLQLLLLFFISSWWMLIFAADARGTMLASIMSVVVIIVLFKRKTFEFLKIYGFTAIVGLILYLVLFLIPKESSREIFSRFGDSGRLEVWLFSLEQIFQNPLIGLGPMHFSYLGINPPWSTPHNFLLQTASEWGIPALLVLVGITLTVIYRFLKQSLEIARNSDNIHTIHWRVALIASFTAVLVHSMFSGLINTPLSQLLGAIILGTTIGEYFHASNNELFQNRVKRSWYVYVLIIVLFANSFYVGVKVISDIPLLDERQNEYLQNYKSTILYPRFWNQGMIFESENQSKEVGEKKSKESQF